MKALRTALVSIAAVLASFGVMYGVCLSLGVNASPAVLAAALTVGLMQRPERLGPKELLLKFLKLPFIALAAGLVGFSFLKAPVLGAVLFTAGIVISILLRRYGERSSAIGRVIALSFLSILVVPVRVEVPGNPWLLPLLVILAGVAAEAGSFAVSWLAVRTGFMPEIPAEPKRPRAGQPAREGQLHIATRMALQMLVALGLAFVIGMTVFPQHWFWVVLTAFIVCSGAVGRGEAVYKGILRLGGALVGALLAALVTLIAFPNPETYAAAVFFVLFLGIWLRQINYAYWAAAATLIFALLQESEGAAVTTYLEMRLLGIVMGALCGVAATWFVYPIRTDQLVKKRVAEALGALRETLGHKPGTPEQAAGLAALDHHAAELTRIAPPVHLHRKVFGAKQPERHPATWIDLMHALLAEARTGGFDRARLGAEMKRLGAMLKGRTESPE